MPEINLATSGFGALQESNDMIEQILRGRDEIKTKYQEQCEARDGKLTGRGPQCEDEEEGENALATCIFDRTQTCISRLASDYKSACNMWVDGAIAETKGLGFDVPDTPCSEEETLKNMEEDYFSAPISHEATSYGENTPVNTTNIDGGDENADGGEEDEKENEGEEEDEESDATSGNTINSMKKAAECAALSAMITFNRCMKDADEDCGCKNCLYTPGNTRRPEEDSDIPVEDADKDVEETDTPEDTSELQQVRTNSAYGFIPKVFGRYVVGGNIIWVGNKVEQEIAFRKRTDNGESINLTTNVVTIDMIIGVSAGVLNNLLRVWADETLLFNRLLDVNESGQVDLTSGNLGYSDLDFSLYAGDEMSTAHVDNVRPRIRLIPGTETQKVPAELTKELPFGRIPAHRGLSYVVIRNFDISLFDSTFPSLRFDVQSGESGDESPIIESMVVPVEPFNFEVDPRLNKLYVPENTDVVLYNQDTLVEEHRVELPVDFAWQTNLRSGSILAVNSDGDMSIIDPFKERIDATGVTAGGWVGFETFSAVEQYARTEFECFIIPQANTSFELFKYNYNTFKLERVRNITGDADLYIQGGAVIDVFGRVFYLSLAFPNGTQNRLSVNRYRMKEESGILSPVVDVKRYSIPSSAWGGDTTVTEIVHVIHSIKDNSITLLLIADGQYYAIKMAFTVDMAELNVVWSTQLDDLPVNLPSRNTKVAVGSTFVYATDDNVLHRLDLTDGTVTALGTLDSLALPDMIGGQRYDDITDSLTYATSDSTLARTFFNRVTPKRTNFKEVLDYMVDRTRLPAGLFDATDVEDITVDGLVLDGSTTVSNFMSSTAELFQYTMVDDGTRLYAIKEGTAGGEDIIDERYVINGQIETGRLVTNIATDTLAVEFYNINVDGLFKVRQSVSLEIENDDQTAESSAISVNINENQGAMRARAEQVVRNRKADKYTFEVALMPRYLGLTPKDRVTYGDVVYTATDIGNGADFATSLSAKVIDHAAYAINVEVDAIVLANSDRILRDARGESPYRPVALFIPALRNDQIAYSIDTNQIVYVGIDTPHRTNVVPTSFKMQMAEGPAIPPNPYRGFNIETSAPASPVYRTASLTQGVHIGRLVTAPDPLEYGIYQTDDTSAMVVKFDHPDTVDFFKATTGLYDIQETVTDNLLIVGSELIQFKEWTVDPDGVTVTFSILFRGRFSTDGATKSHVTGETVYLYTPESLRPIAVNPLYTKYQQAARMFFNDGVAPAGSYTVSYSQRGDAGSSRPPAPAHITRWGAWMYPFPTDQLELSWVRRRAFVFDMLEDGGEVPNDYGEDNLERYMIFVLKEPPDLASFNINVLRTFNEVNVLETYARRYVTTYPYDPPYMYLGTVNDMDMLVDTVHIAICQIDIHPTAGLIVGHPTFRTFKPGVYPSYEP